MPLPRYGVVVPKHRHTIVERNLLRRRLREIGRRDVLPALRACPASFDVLVRARPEAYSATFAELRNALVRFTEELCSGASHSA
jgi:ribonuclease P protein component